MSGIPSHFDGRSMTRILTLGLAFLCSLTLLSCGLANGPERAAKAWFEATERGEVLEADELVCEEQKDSFREGAFVLSGIYTFAEEFLGTDQPLEIDASDIEYSRVDSLSSDERVVVEVEGEIRMAALGIVDSEELYYLWVMVNEDGQWKWCGTTSWVDESAAVQDTNRADTATHAPVEPEESNKQEVITPASAASLTVTSEDSNSAPDAQEQDRFAFLLRSHSNSRFILFIGVDGNDVGSERILYEGQYPESPYLDNPEIAWSPETKRLLFTEVPAGADNPALFVVGIDGSGALQLSLPEEEPFNPTWIDNGTRIRFLTTRTGFYTFAGTLVADSVVYVDPDGSNREVKNLPDIEGQSPLWFWSPDEKTSFAVVAETDDSIILGLQLYKADADGENLQQIPVELDPFLDPLSGQGAFAFTMSPDGSKIAFALSSSNIESGELEGVDLLVLELSSGELTAIPYDDNERVLFPLGWAPDNEQVIVISHSKSGDGLPELYLIDRVSGEQFYVDEGNGIPRQVTDSCQVSPDGKRFVINSYAEGFRDLHWFDMLTRESNGIWQRATVFAILGDTDDYSVESVCWISE